MIFLYLYRLIFVWIKPLFKIVKMEIENNLWHHSNYITIVVTLIFGPVAIISNLFLIWLILRNWSQRKPFEILLLSMALNDFCATVTSTVQQPYFLIKTESRDSIGCKLAGMVTFSLGMMKIVQPPIIMLNRYNYKMFVFTNNFTFLLQVSLRFSSSNQWSSFFQSKNANNVFDHLAIGATCFSTVFAEKCNWIHWFGHMWY